MIELSNIINTFKGDYDYSKNINLVIAQLRKIIPKSHNNTFTIVYRTVITPEVLTYTMLVSNYSGRLISLGIIGGPINQTRFNTCVIAACRGIVAGIIEIPHTLISPQCVKYISQNYPHIELKGYKRHELDMLPKMVYNMLGIFGNPLFTPFRLHIIIDTQEMLNKLIGLVTGNSDLLLRNEASILGVSGNTYFNTERAFGLSILNKPYTEEELDYIESIDGSTAYTLGVAPRRLTESARGPVVYYPGIDTSMSLIFPNVENRWDHRDYDKSIDFMHSFTFEDRRRNYLGSGIMTRIVIPRSKLFPKFGLDRPPVQAPDKNIDNLVLAEFPAFPTFNKENLSKQVGNHSDYKRYENKYRSVLCNYRPVKMFGINIRLEVPLASSTYRHDKFDLPAVLPKSGEFVDNYIREGFVKRHVQGVRTQVNNPIKDPNSLDCLKNTLIKNKKNTLMIEYFFFHSPFLQHIKLWIYPHR